MAVKVEAGRGQVAVLSFAAYTAFFGVLVVSASLPSIQGEFGETVRKSGQVISMSLLGMATGYLIGGPVSDRIGRRPMLASGLLLFSLLSAAAPFSRSIEVLHALRFGQSLFAGCAVIVIAPIFRDTYQGRIKAATRANLCVLIATALGSISGVWIGSLIEATLEWRYSFWLTACLGLLAGVACRFGVPETLVGGEATTGRAFRLAGFATRGAVMLPAAIGGLSVGATYVFVGTGPVLVMDGWGYSPKVFAAVATIPTIAMVTTALVVRYFSDRLDFHLLAVLAAIVQLAGGAIFLFGHVMGRLDLPAFFLCACLVYLSNAVLPAFSTSAALAAASCNTGAVGSVVGVLHIGAGAAGAFLPTLYPGAAGIHVPVGLTVAGTLSVLLCVAARSKNRRSRTAPLVR